MIYYSKNIDSYKDWILFIKAEQVPNGAKRTENLGSSCLYSTKYKHAKLFKTFNSKPHAIIHILLSTDYKPEIYI